MIEFKIGNKAISIFNKKMNKSSNMPIVIYNSFQGNGKELWNKCIDLNCNDFTLVNISNINWNDEMTPWKCPPLYKNDTECKGKADDYLLELTNNIIPSIEERINYKPTYYAIAGYSLGGLFAIYSIYKTNIFKKTISASGSLWYPNFLDYVKENEPLNKIEKLYISLGDKEKESKNKILSTVEDKTIELVDYFKIQNVNTKFEFNEGNHFRDNYLRIAKGIKWTI